MKFIASVLLIAAMLLEKGTAFTSRSPAFGVSRMPASATRTATRTYLGDPEMIHHLGQHCTDAIRVVLMECNNEQCVEVQGFPTSDGWHFTEGLPGPTKARILMVEVDDTE